MAEFDWPQSEAKYDVAVLRDVTVPMRDGVELAADIYRPVLDGELASGPFPAVLIRTPYDKNASLAGNGPEFWARRGYVQVVQDVRGRFNSGGDFYLLRDEGPDGYDTIEWVAAQPWCDGQVGTMGTSYLAWVQSAAACHNPPHLSAMWVNQGAFNGLTSSLRHGGALELRWLSWAFWGGSLSKEARADPLVATTLDRGATAFRDWLRRMPWQEGETPLASALLRSDSPPKLPDSRNRQAAGVPVLQFRESCLCAFDVTTLEDRFDGEDLDKRVRHAFVRCRTGEALPYLLEELFVTSKYRCRHCTCFGEPVSRATAQGHCRTRTPRNRRHRSPEAGIRRANRRQLDAIRNGAERSAPTPGCWAHAGCWQGRLQGRPTP